MTLKQGTYKVSVSSFQYMDENGAIIPADSKALAVAAKTKVTLKILSRGKLEIDNAFIHLNLHYLKG